MLVARSIGTSPGGPARNPVASLVKILANGDLIFGEVERNGYKTRSEEEEAGNMVSELRLIHGDEGIQSDSAFCWALMAMEVHVAGVPIGLPRILIAST